MSSDLRRVILQIVLGIVIVVLSYVLYRSIVDPYAATRAEERRQQRVRERMDLTRTALIRYRDLRGRFPGTLDSLAQFVQQTPAVRSEIDSLAGGANLPPDSLLQSPVSGQPFAYETSPDSLRVDIYRLRSPDSNDQIGSLDQNPTQVNAASWE